jgi:hypothetical protein
MTKENNEATRNPSSTPSSPKDEQDQVFGHQAEERKEATETGGAESTDSGRPPEPHAGGKA